TGATSVNARPRRRRPSPEYVRPARIGSGPKPLSLALDRVLRHVTDRIEDAGTLASPKAAAQLAQVPLKVVLRGIIEGTIRATRRGCELLVRLEDVDRLAEGGGRG